MSSLLADWLPPRRARVEDALRRFLPRPARFGVLHDAMAWMLLGEGKRLRPVLAIASFEAVGGGSADPRVLPAACAVEMVHAYSLVHDDLPAMDDDSVRRGRPTVHVRFGEAAAILAGDALLTEAFRLVLDPGAYEVPVPAERIVRVGGALASAAGRTGMVGGQSLDMGIEGQGAADVASLEHLHRRKTGELFRFSTLAGAVLGGADEGTVDALAEYGETLGLAFQVADDLLDLLEDDDSGGRDAAETPSFPALIGEAASRLHAAALADRACELVAPLGAAAAPLRELARYAVERDK